MNEKTEPGYAEVTFPYEFLPLPEKGQKGTALGRSGEPVCEAEVVGVKRTKAFDHTAIVTIKVPAGMAMKARFFKAADAVAEA